MNWLPANDFHTIYRSGGSTPHYQLKIVVYLQEMKQKLVIVFVEIKILFMKGGFHE